MEARKYNDTADGGADDTTADHQSLMSGDRARGEGEIPAVRSLTERRLRAHIPADTRPLPSVEKYDQLLQSVQGNAVYQQMVAAQANFEKLMPKVNERIYDGIKKGSASPIITLG